MYRRELNNRKVMICILSLVIVSVLTMTLAYAALSVALKINGSAEIVASSWDIHLANPKVKPGSITTQLPTIKNGNTIDFNVSFNGIEQFYEFTVDIVNEGTIDAMIDEVIKTPELTAEQAKYINYELSYVNGDMITEKHNLKASSSVPIRVRIGFRNDITNAADLPTSTVKLSLSITLTYIQSDNTSTAVSGDGILALNGSLDEIGTIVTIGTEQFYTIGSDNNNVKLLSMYNLHVGGECLENEYTPYGNTATGRQGSNILGWNSNDLYSRGVIEFSNNGTSYAGSTAESHVNNYKNIIEEYGVNVVEARLINLDELYNIFGCENYECKNTIYPWIYSTSYWTQTAYDSKYMWAVYNDGYISDYEKYSYPKTFGIRPVIVVPKEDIII